jgi:hypothetical protein
MTCTDDLLNRPTDADPDEALRQLIAAHYPFDQWLDVLQVAGRVCRTEEAVRVWCRNGLGRKVGGKYWIGEHELADFLAGRKLKKSNK